MTTALASTAKLGDGQFSLDDGIVFGFDLPVAVHGPPALADADMTTQDANNARADNRRFGRDYTAGREWTFDLYTDADDAGGGVDTLAELHAAWDAKAVRNTPGAVSTLRYAFAGRTRRVYGRARKFAPALTYAWTGRTEATATFDTVDPYHYDDAEQGITVPLMPPPSGGMTLPLVLPLTTVATSTGSGEFTVAGTVPTWCAVELTGPITNPVLTLLNRWVIRLNYTLAYDEVVTIDPRSWVATVTNNFGVNLAGKLTADSVPLSKLQVPPGPNEVTLRGTDQTGTSSAMLTWRGAYASF